MHNCLTVIFAPDLPSHLLKFFNFANIFSSTILPLQCIPKCHCLLIPSMFPVTQCMVISNPQGISSHLINFSHPTPSHPLMVPKCLLKAFLFHQYFQSLTVIIFSIFSSCGSFTTIIFYFNTISPSNGFSNILDTTIYAGPLSLIIQFFTVITSSIF